MMSYIRKGPLILLIIGSIVDLSLFVRADEPVKQCNNGDLQYKIGKSYIYNYGSEASGFIEFGPKSDPQPALNINATAILTRLSECDYVLTLEDIVINSRPITNNGKLVSSNKLQVEKSSVKFSMNNGNIEEVLINPEDSSWTANLKKAVLFTIQNQAFSTGYKDTDTETSVFGNCVTDVYKNGDGQYDKKTHLKECGQGEGSDLVFQGVPYEVPLVTNKPVFGFLRMDPYLTCSQTLEDGILTQVSCTESNIHNPGYEKSLASSLKHNKTVDKVVQDEDVQKLSMPSSILFNFTKSYTTGMEQSALAKVNVLLSTLDSDGINKAEVFIELKKALARISHLDQFTESEQLTKEMTKKIFYDALAEVTTDESVRICAKLVNQRQFDTTTQLNFYTNIAFSTSPGTKGLEALATLVQGLEVKKVEEESEENMKEYKSKLSLGQHLLLGASGFAHQYCKLANPDCINTPEYVDLVNAIAAHAKTGETEEILLGALHALGNLDALTPAAVEAIKTLLTADNAATIWLEIQALDGFRRDPCQPALKEIARKSLADSSKTDQVRIHSYLAVSRCFQDEDLPIIQGVFAEDQSAVGGFIGSHIRNIQDSSSPSKITLKTSMAQINLPENILPVHNESRASKYIEYSMFKEKENYGFSGEATIIFIPGQTKPEFVSFNATLDLLGRSFNFLEVGLSQRFAIKPMIFQAEDAPAEWSIENAITAKDTYIRVLGTTVGLGLEDIQSALQTSIVKMMSGDTPSITLDAIQPSSFFDEELTFPSISGLPVTYDLQAVKFDSIKFDLVGVTSMGDLFKQNEDGFNIKLTVNLNSATTLKSSVGVGANTPVHSGYRVEGKLDHKQNFGVQVISKTGPQLDLDLKINFPENVISSREFYGDFFSYEEFQGNFVKLRDAAKKGDTSLVKATQQRRCLTSRGLGLQFCVGQASGSGQDFPMEVKYTLEKEDPEMKGFDFHITSDCTTPNIYSYQVDVSTPDSKVQRDMKITIKSDEGNELEPGYWDSKEITVVTQLGDEKYKGRILWNRSEVIMFPAMLPHNYQLVIDYSVSEKSKPVELINFKLDQPKINAVNSGISFNGPLRHIGDIKYNIETASVYDRELRREVNSSYTKHFSWESDVFGSTVADVHAEHDENNFSMSVKVNRNNRIYEVKQTSDVQEVLQDEEYSNWDGVTFKSKRTVEWKYRYDIEYIHHPNKKYEIELGMGALHGANNGEKRNATMIIKSASLKAPIMMEIHIAGDGRDAVNSSLTIDADGHRQVDINGTFNSRYGQLEGEIKDHAKFNGNLTLENEHQHIHMDVKCLRSNWHLVLDSDINDDGNELKQKTDVFVQDKDKIPEGIKTESYTVINRSKRTVDTLSKTTQGKEQLLSKFQMHTEFAEEFLNGRNFATLQLEDANKQVYTGSINQTIASSDKKLDSQLSADFTPVGQTPYTFTWDLKCDGTSAYPDLYDYEWHVTSDKHFRMTLFKPNDIDILVNKDITFHKKAGEEEYEFMTASNITSDGKLAITTELQLSVSGGPEWESGTVKAVGFSQDDINRDDLTGTLVFQGKPNEVQTQNINFEVVRKNLESEVSSNLLEGSVNKSVNYQNIMDFEATEMGRVRVQDTKTISWSQLVRFHDKEFTFFKEIKETDGEQVEDTKFLMDISAKVTEDNHQTRFLLTTQHSLNPDCPVSNLNFTLSK